MSSGDGKRRRVLSPEERVLWTTVTKSIAPLRESSASGEEEGATMASAPPASSARWEATGIDTPAAGEKTAAAACAARPPDETARRQRGKEAIDGRLDLHGLTQSEAHAALLRFLRARVPAARGWCWSSPVKALVPVKVSAAS